MSEPLIEPGTRVMYWGIAANAKYYGTPATVLWANDCSCAHQTYCLETIAGTQLSKVQRESFVVIDDEE
jgi:hypothetical protein